MSREPFDAAAAPALQPSQFVSGNEAKASEEKAAPAKGRRKVHASAAARVAAYRASRRRMDFVTTPRIDDTVASLAAHFDVSKNEVLNSLVRFALTNRNFKQVGLYGLNHQDAAQEPQA